MNVISISSLPAPVAPSTSLASPSLTAEEFLERHGHQRVELVKGQIVESPMPSQLHGYICAEATGILRDFVKANDFGRIMCNDSFVLIRRDPDTVRGADVNFFSYERLPRGPVPGGLIEVAPDLVVEVRSPSETWMQVFTKVLEYLNIGVRAVVVVDEETRTASVYRPTVLQETFSSEQELTVPEVLPGFSVVVGRFFE